MAEKNPIPKLQFHLFKKPKPTVILNTVKDLVIRAAFADEILRELRMTNWLFEQLR